MTGETKFMITTGNLKPGDRNSRKAVAFCKRLPGLYGVVPMYPKGLLWLFDDEESAELAEIRMTMAGVPHGRGVFRVELDENGQPRTMEEAD